MVSAVTNNIIQKIFFWALKFDSLTTICPSLQFILLTHGPILEIFAKKYWELAELENDIFWGGYWIFQKKCIYMFFFSQWKSPWLSYEVAFISALWMFFQNLEKGFIRSNMPIQLYRLTVYTIYNLGYMCSPISIIRMSAISI